MDSLRAFQGFAAAKGQSPGDYRAPDAERGSCRRRCRQRYPGARGQARGGGEGGGGGQGAPWS